MNVHFLASLATNIKHLHKKDVKLKYSCIWQLAASQNCSFIFLSQFPQSLLTSSHRRVRS